MDNGEKLCKQARSIRLPISYTNTIIWLPISYTNSVIRLPISYTNTIIRLPISYTNTIIRLPISYTWSPTCCTPISSPHLGPTVTVDTTIPAATKNVDPWTHTSKSTPCVHIDVQERKYQFLLWLQREFCEATSCSS